MAAEVNEAKAVEYKAWVESHTIDQIRIANNARALLRRKLAGKYKSMAYPAHTQQLIDERRPKRTLNPWGFFFTERVTSPDFNGIKIHDRLKLISGEWKALSADEKKVCYPGSNVEPKLRCDNSDSRIRLQPTSRDTNARQLLCPRIKLDSLLSLHDFPCFLISRMLDGWIESGVTCGNLNVSQPRRRVSRLLYRGVVTGASGLDIRACMLLSRVASVRIDTVVQHVFPLYSGPSFCSTRSCVGYGGRLPTQ